MSSISRPFSHFNGSADFIRRYIQFPLPPCSVSMLSSAQNTLSSAIFQQYHSFSQQDSCYSIVSTEGDLSESFFSVDLSDKDADYWTNYCETLDAVEQELRKHWKSLEMHPEEGGDFQEFDSESEPVIGNPDYDESARYILSVIALLKCASNPFEVMFEVYNEDSCDEDGTFYIGRDSFLSKDSTDFCSFYEQRLLAEDMNILITNLDDPQQLAIQHIIFAVEQALQYACHLNRTLGEDEDFSLVYRDMVHNLNWLKNEASLDLTRRLDIAAMTGRDQPRLSGEDIIFSLFDSPSLPK